MFQFNNIKLLNNLIIRNAKQYKVLHHNLESACVTHIVGKTGINIINYDLIAILLNMTCNHSNLRITVINKHSQEILNRFIVIIIFPAWVVIITIIFVK